MEAKSKTAERTKLRVVEEDGIEFEHRHYRLRSRGQHTWRPQCRYGALRRPFPGTRPFLEPFPGPGLLPPSGSRRKPVVHRPV